MTKVFNYWRTLEKDIEAQRIVARRTDRLKACVETKDSDQMFSEMKEVIFV